jgi:hypothetical protein
MRRPVARPLSCLLSGALLLALLPTPASARTRDTLDGTASNFSTTQTCRGHKILATVDTVVEDFSVYLQNSAGHNLDWYVYESTSSTGTYTRIAHNQTVGSASGTYAWQNSGPLFGNITDGRYYVLAACWNATSSVTINYTSSTLPASPSWGTWQTGSFLNVAPPPASTTWSNTTARPNMQIFSSAGSSVSASGVVGSTSFTNTIIRGNSYTVTRDTYLTDVRQYLQVTASSGGTFGLGTYSVPWYVYRRAGTCTSGQPFSQVATFSGFGLGSSGATFTTWAAWNPNLLMEAGYCYFIGIDHNSGGTGPQRTYYELGAGQQARWGTNAGYSSINQTGAGGPTETVTINSSYQVVQRIGAVRDTESSEVATGTFTVGATAEFGNIFQVTTPTHISEMAVQIDPNYAGTVSLAVYESATQAGAYTRIWSGEVEHDDVGKGWLISQELDLDLDPAALGGTGFYLFVAETNGAATLYRDLVASGTAAFGQRVGAHWNNTSAAGLPATLNAAYQGRFYDWRIVSCDDCVDLDGDGFELSQDCDDDNASINPAAAEICDGVDNNCDGALIAGGESDSDQDGQRACAGDCDDSYASTYLGASEICDGADNDCNGTLPTSEQDADQDGFLTCTLTAAPIGNVIGGGDCNDNSSSTSPGIAFEACDGIDSNCDGLSWIVSTGELGNSYFPVASAFVGGVYQVAVDTVVQGVKVNGIAPQGTTVTAAVYTASTQNGPWTLAATGTPTSSAAGSAPSWLGAAPGDLSVPLSAGQYALIGTHWSSTMQYQGDSQVSYPRSAAFGTQVGVVGEILATLPATLSSSTVTSANAGLRVYTDRETDGDGDGYRQCAECDDTEATVFPTAPELCDGLDNNCDGTVPANEVDGDQDSSLACADCNDGNSTVFPGAAELCDGLDNNCDGSIPSTGAGSENDVDGDGARVCAGDCNDNLGTVGPGFTEICDARDSNCDGVIPASEVDGDADGYIDCVLTPGGSLPGGVQGGSDCNDTDNAVYPGAPELCDGGTVDNNCNGTASDEGADVDGDGSNTCTDCDDSDANVFPGAAEICDGKNSDCAGGIPATEQDPDGDGYIACTLAAGANLPGFLSGGGDCLINDPQSYPGAVELCDGIDNDCNGSVPATEQDPDNDGVSACAGDCRPSDGNSYPGAAELCDGIDNDCNGSVPANEADGDSDNQRICAGDCNDGNANIYTGNAEVCDGLNNDCAGGVDDGFDGDADGFFDGANSGCVAAYAQVDCNDAVGTIYPGAAEVCDGVDQDCDSLIDDGFDGDGDGFFDASVPGCASTYGANADCNDGAFSIKPGAPEVCDGVDQDCDSTIDEGFDTDSDGYFTAANAGCLATYGASADCNDGVASTNPGATEACNGVDDDCDTTIDDGFDDDGDGYFDASVAGCVTTYGALADCDDGEGTTWPGAPELCDLADNDCDSLIDEDFDLDGDSYFDISCPGGDDCDDGNANINPSVAETCDGNDQDCDGAVDNGFDGDGDGAFDVTAPGCAATWGVLADCDDSDGSIYPSAVEVCDAVDQDCDTLVDEDFDLDGDGSFDQADAGCAAAYAAGVLDCDDAVSTTYGGAPELCNGVDDDCDSPAVIDEGFDGDNDGFFDGSNPDCVAAYASVDCDDAAPAVYPGATEVCNGIDDDCTGGVPGDEIDNDGDGFNECADGDCNDANNAVFAGALELCNGVDDNCTGGIDETFDVDNDGYTRATTPGCVATYGAAGVDCNDTNPAINPGATEVCNGLDDNCVGGADEPFDGDGDSYFEAVACAGQYLELDCDDTLASVNPGQSEDCTNGIDDDCDGSADIGFDVDLDGTDTCNGDCNDANPAINPGATEVCDLVDNNCNQQIDEGFDVDSDSFTSCNGDCADNDAAVNPNAPELCDAIDNDCDTDVDEDFDLDEDGTYDESAAGCLGVWPAGSLDCDDGNPNINPAATEICDALDNDCDGTIDAPFDLDFDGAFTAANANCVNAYGAAADCDDADPLTYPGAVELCDGLDNDCNVSVPVVEIDNDVDGWIECEPEANHVGSPLGGGDCDDGVAAINPGAAELCNLIDEDCDGLIDEDFDGDGDGAPDDAVAACQAFYPPEDLDCDDGDPNVGPLASEVCDAADNDCDGDVDEDFDLDYDGTFDGDDPDCVLAYPSTDCDDGDPAVFPGNLEDCSNGIDDNCNGAIDEDTDADSDGFSTCAGDCDDGDPNINPSVIEVCDGVDQDCNFLIDELFDGDGDEFLDLDDCAAAYPADELDCDDGDPAVNPDATELCNAADDDCDGQVDELFDLDSDSYFDRLNVDCIQAYGALQTDCDDADPTLNPGATEVCNALDDDCDGISDEGFDLDSDGVWLDDAGCNATYGGPGDCDDGDPLVHPSYDDGAGTVIEAADELCDGVDNDCDGVIPEDADGDGFVDAENADCAGLADLDCDDGDPLVNPDAVEICDDGVDNDCNEDIDDEDPACQGDDDDATGDDDDATDPVVPPVVDPDFDGDGVTLAGGCGTCLGSVAGPEPSGLGLGIVGALGLLGLLRRRRDRARAGGAHAALVLVAGLLLGGLAAPHAALGQDMEQEAERQLDFAWKELEAKSWDKAISSAESALRLNPALYTAMVVKAIAYEGKGELRKAESWLQTYLELTRSLNQAPQAVELADRLKEKMGGGSRVKAETTATVGVKRTAFGDGSVTFGGLVGARSYSQSPCAQGEGCVPGAETRPGFWATDSTGFGGGLWVRAEYFFGGWLLGLRVRYDLGAGEPIGVYDVAAHSKPGHRLDAHIVFRPQLLSGLTSLRLLADVGYGMRTWSVYETVEKNSGGGPDTAAALGVVAHEFGGGIGVRVEPGQVLGIDFRYGVAGLMGAAGGINDHSVEVGVGIRPAAPLLVRAGFDMHVGSLFVQSERAGVTQRAGLDTLRAGLFVGAGLAF